MKTIKAAKLLSALILAAALVVVPSVAISRERIGDWNVGCRLDKVTLVWECSAAKGGSGLGVAKLRVSHRPTSGICFMGAWNDSPGTTATVRIGRNEPITYDGTMVCGAVAELIVRELQGEERGAARGFSWPRKVDEYEFDSSGFRAAYAALEDRIANPRE